MLRWAAGERAAFDWARVGVAVWRRRRLNLEEGPAAVADEGEREQLQLIISNSRLAEHYLALARDLDVLEPKLPEDVYKSHLVSDRWQGGGGLEGS